MNSALPALAQPALRSVPVAAHIRPGEWVALGFFVFLAGIGMIWPIPSAHRATLCCVPILLWSVWRLESLRSRPWSRLFREWSSLTLIPVGYWLLGWFSSPPHVLLQARWLEWDRTLLDGLGLRWVIEAGGIAVPELLEAVYLCLYALPAAALGIAYACGARSRSNRLILALFLGTFSSYALLPFLPVSSPRLAYPGKDLPRFAGPARLINIWLLDHWDISTSVFPSGHVAVAFSSAFGLLGALRGRRRICVTAFVAAILVYLATIYGRYHYAVDGFASFLIAAAMWRISEVCLSNE
jgi:membrane-associated phospholipid phosphatase